MFQPGGNQKRFDHDLEKLREDLAVKYNNKIYLEMDRYDLIPEKGRCHEITVYLNEHKDIERFVILDDDNDYDFKANYPGQFVYCPYVFNEECYQKALDILTKPIDGLT